jgi:hypothetical protein
LGPAKPESETPGLSLRIGILHPIRVWPCPVFSQERSQFPDFPESRTLPAIVDPFTAQAGNVAGFSLHAGVAAKANKRDKLERLCRYITRPAVSEKRLSLTEHGQVRYSLKNPWRDGTTQVIFEPLDFIARLAALVPTPRINLTRFHGVFAPNSRHRALITPAGRGKERKSTTTHATEDQPPAEHHAAMT